MLVLDNLQDEISNASRSNSANQFRTEVPGVILHSAKKPMILDRSKYNLLHLKADNGKQRKTFSKRKSVEPITLVTNPSEHPFMYHPTSLLSHPRSNIGKLQQKIAISAGEQSAATPNNPRLRAYNSHYDSSRVAFGHSARNSHNLESGADLSKFASPSMGQFDTKDTKKVAVTAFKFADYDLLGISAGATTNQNMSSTHSSKILPTRTSAANMADSRKSRSPGIGKGYQRLKSKFYDFYHFSFRNKQIQRRFAKIAKHFHFMKLQDLLEQRQAEPFCNKLLNMLLLFFEELDEIPQTTTAKPTAARTESADPTKVVSHSQMVNVVTQPTVYISPSPESPAFAGHRSSQILTHNPEASSPKTAGHRQQHNQPEISASPCTFGKKQDHLARRDAGDKNGIVRYSFGQLKAASDSSPPNQGLQPRNVDFSPYFLAKTSGLSLSTAGKHQTGLIGPDISAIEKNKQQDFGSSERRVLFRMSDDFFTVPKEQTKPRDDSLQESQQDIPESGLKAKHVHGSRYSANSRDQPAKPKDGRIGIPFLDLGILNYTDHKQGGGLMPAPTVTNAAIPEGFYPKVPDPALGSLSSQTSPSRLLNIPAESDQLRVRESRGQESDPHAWKQQLFGANFTEGKSTVGQDLQSLLESLRSQRMRLAMQKKQQQK